MFLTLKPANILSYLRQTVAVAKHSQRFFLGRVRAVLVEWISRDGTKIGRFDYTTPCSIFHFVLPRSPRIHTETSHHDADPYLPSQNIQCPLTVLYSPCGGEFARFRPPPTPALQLGIFV
jgi:hypothetical protein